METIENNSLSISELISREGYENFMERVKTALTSEEYDSILGPGKEFDAADNIIRDVHTNLTLANHIFTIMGNSEYARTIEGMPEIELETSTNFNLDQAREMLSQSPNHQLSEMLGEYIDSLVNKIGYKLSLVSFDKMIETIKEIVAFDKQQYEQSGEQANAITLDHRLYRDAEYLVRLEAIL